MAEPSGQVLTFLLPQIVMISFALLAPALDLMTASNGKRLIGVWSLIGLIFTLILTLNVGGLLPLGFSSASLADAGGGAVVLFNGTVIVDAFYVFFSLVFLTVAIVVVTASLTYIAPQEPHQGEYYALVLLSTVGMTIVAFAGDFILLFVGLELSTLSTFALVAFRKKERKSMEAGVKYFIIGGLSSAFLLYGISLIFGITGTTNLTEIHHILDFNTPFKSTVVLAVILVVAGLGFKMSMVPFHMWVPDTYQGAATTVTAFLAAASKKMGFAAGFIVFVIALAAFRPVVVVLLGALAVATMTVGNLGALRQTSVKRLLAYSSIAQAGYILIAVTVASPTAITGGIYYMLAHALMGGGGFLVVAIALKTGIGDSIEDYSGLYRRAPILALSMAILLFSLAGFPPLAGFWAKFLVFASALEAGGNFIWLAVAGILNSALSVYYYVKVIRAMYVAPTKETVPQRIVIPNALGAALTITVVGTVLIGLVSDPLVAYAKTAAVALLHRG